MASELLVNKITPESGTTLTLGESGDTISFGTGTTPQLGGDLDLNSNDITGTGNINITGNITASGNLTSVGIDDNATSTAITIDSNETSTLQCSAGDSNFALLAYHPTSTSTRTIAKFQSNVGGTQEDKVVIQTSGNVGIGTSSPAVPLHIADSNPRIRLEDSDASSHSEIQSNGQGDLILKADPDNNGSSTQISFETDGSERMRITNGGRVGIDSTNPDFKFICNENRTDFMARFFNDGNTDTRKGIIIQCGSDTGAGTNRPLTFRDGNGTTVGEITFTGGTVTYGPFTAHHPCFLPEGVTEYPYGTLLEIVSIFNREQDGVTYERGIRYNVQKTQSENSKSVLGAYSGPMATEEEPDAHQVYILGDGHILCNNSGGNISIGDGICSSSTAGIGKKATDNPSMIIGIAQENVTFENDTETKLVAVQYGLQQFIPWGN